MIKRCLEKSLPVTPSQLVSRIGIPSYQTPHRGYVGLLKTMIHHCYVEENTKYILTQSNQELKKSASNRFFMKFLKLLMKFKSSPIASLHQLLQRLPKRNFTTEIENEQIFHIKARSFISASSLAHLKNPVAVEAQIPYPQSLAQGVDKIIPTIKQLFLKYKAFPQDSTTLLRNLLCQLPAVNDTHLHIILCTLHQEFRSLGLPQYSKLTLACLFHKPYQSIDKPDNYVSSILLTEQIYRCLLQTYIDTNDSESFYTLLRSLSLEEALADIEPESSLCPKSGQKDLNTLFSKVRSTENSLNLQKRFFNSGEPQSFISYDTWKLAISGAVKFKDYKLLEALLCQVLFRGTFIHNDIKILVSPQRMPPDMKLSNNINSVRDLSLIFRKSTIEAWLDSCICETKTTRLRTRFDWLYCDILRDKFLLTRKSFRESLQLGTNLLDNALIFKILLLSVRLESTVRVFKELDILFDLELILNDHLAEASPEQQLEMVMTYHKIKNSRIQLPFPSEQVEAMRKKVERKAAFCHDVLV